MTPIHFPLLFYVAIFYMEVIFYEINADAIGNKQYVLQRKIIYSRTIVNMYYIIQVFNRACCNPSSNLFICSILFCS